LASVHIFYLNGRSLVGLCRALISVGLSVSFKKEMKKERGKDTESKQKKGKYDFAYVFWYGAIGRYVEL
jgi:hypothetical protein